MAYSYSENCIRSRIRDHINTHKHSDAVARARKGNFPQSDESSDDDDPASQGPKLPNVKTYIARSDAEIAAALELVAQNEENVARGEMEEDGHSLDGAIDGSDITGTVRPGRRDRCWNYMRFTGKQNSMGKDEYECIFCNFELRAHISALKAHLCRRCPGVPMEIRNSIKEDGKRS